MHALFLSKSGTQTIFANNKNINNNNGQNGGSVTGYLTEAVADGMQ